MAIDVDIKITPELRALMTKVPENIVMQAVRRAMDEQNELTIGVATVKRLSFPAQGKTTPEGLRAITNILRRSIRKSDAEITGNKVLSAIGSNVRYFAVHEFGFQGSVSVHQHLRSTPQRFVQLSTGKQLSLSAASRSGLLTKKGAPRKNKLLKVLGGVGGVRGHTRKMNMPARRMIQRTIEERTTNYVGAIELKVRDYLAKANILIP